LTIAYLFFAAKVIAAEGRSGEQIYRQQCAACHGAKGEGSDEHKRPLMGDRSVAQLARLIAKSMPKDAEKKCTGEEAQKVAAYIYETFYSKMAQARNKPPRIELSRLTVRQYGMVQNRPVPGNTFGGLQGAFSDGRRSTGTPYGENCRAFPGAECYPDFNPAGNIARPRWI
jgi:cytochrome c